jgi:hypothetical protein
MPAILEMSLWTVFIKNFVHADFVSKLALLSAELSMSRNNSVTTPVGSLPLHVTYF